MVTLVDVLDEFDARDIRVALSAGTRGPGPLLHTDAPTGAIDADLAAAIRQHRDMLIAVILGRATGHAPAPCTVCGQISLVAIVTPAGKPRTAWPTCRYSAHCTNRDDPGRHIPRPADVERTTPRRPPATTQPPTRPEAKRLLGPRLAWPTATREEPSV
jgi:hypothetical protein